MALLRFNDIKFADEKNHPEKIRLIFLKVFSAPLEKSDLEKIGRFQIKDGALELLDTSQARAENKFSLLLSKALNNLKSTLTGRKAVYVHQNSGIPLIGTLYFGIVDRGTNILEIKPITGCNIACPFCSVDEESRNKLVDFVVEDDYLISETEKLIEYKKENSENPAELKIDVFINTHGEPLLYANMENLISGLRKIPEVRTISIITNGTLLTKTLADNLINAGLNQLNLSINAIDSKKAKELAGTDNYSIDNVKDIARHITKKLGLIIAPVWIKGLNDEEIPKIILFAKEIGAKIGIQNYMAHRKGKKIANQTPWEEFYKQLEIWEKETGKDLKFEDHTLEKTKPLEKPFHKNEVIQAEIVSPGRLKKEMLAAANDRVISIVDCYKMKGRIKIRILRDKDNVFVAESA